MHWCIDCENWSKTMSAIVGRSVQIKAGMKEFVGKTGVVQYREDGPDRLYRVRLDEPVYVHSVGLVRDDLWNRASLKLLRD